MTRARLVPPRWLRRFTPAVLAGLALTGQAAAQGSHQAPPSSAELKAAAETVRSAHSAREAGPGLGVLARGAEQSFPLLQELLTASLHPEVRFYLVDAALRNPAPGAVKLAASLLQSSDPDLAMRAARVLANRADRNVAPQLLEAVKARHDPTSLGLLLTGLGRTGDPRAQAVLAGFVRRDAPPSVLAGAAQGLASIPAPDAVPAILGAIGEDTEDWLIASLLSSAQTAVGPQSKAQILATARDPKSPLRLLAVDGLVSLPPDADPAQRGAVAAAAESALDDPNPMVRQRATFALTAATRNAFLYISDPQSVERLLAVSHDPSYRVRLAAIDGLHYTFLRRGITVVGAIPPPLAPETMRLLRWPTDWRLFPRAVELLSDPDPRVQERMAWILGVTTGYWYGYRDISLPGKVQLTPEARSAYAKMWEQMQDKTPAAWTAAALDGAIRRLLGGESTDLDLSTMRAIQLLTARSFGWKQKQTPAERKTALAALEAWWAKNRGGDPAAWIAATLREEGFRAVSDYNLHVLGRWVKTPLPAVAYDPVARGADPEAAQREILAWWDELDAPSKASR